MQSLALFIVESQRVKRRLPEFLDDRESQPERNGVGPACREQGCSQHGLSQRNQIRTDL